MSLSKRNACFVTSSATVATTGIGVTLQGLAKLRDRVECAEREGIVTEQQARGFIYKLDQAERAELALCSEIIAIVTKFDQDAGDATPGEGGDK